MPKRKNLPPSDVSDGINIPEPKKPAGLLATLYNHAKSLSYSQTPNPLDVAAENGDVAGVKALLSTLEIDSKEIGSGYHGLARCKSSPEVITEIFNLLQNSKADMNKCPETKGGACYNHIPLELAIAANNPLVAMLLLNVGAEIVQSRVGYIFESLFKLANPEPWFPFVRELIALKHHIQANHHIPNGPWKMTHVDTFQFAIIKNHLNFVKVFIESDKFCLKSTCKKLNILALAITFKATAVAQYFLDLPNGQALALDSFSLSAMVAINSCFLDKVSNFEGFEINKKLYVSNNKDEYETLLTVALKSGAPQLAMVQLLNLHADPNIANSAGLTPLILAINTGKPELVKLLLKQGVDVTTTVTMGIAEIAPKGFLPQKEQGITALHVAAVKDWKGVEIIPLLIAANASVDAKTHLGTTPLYMAIKSIENTTANVDQLLKAGADIQAATITGDSPLLLSNRSKALVGDPAEIDGEPRHLLLTYRYNRIIREIHKRLKPTIVKDVRKIILGYYGDKPLIPD